MLPTRRTAALALGFALVLRPAGLPAQPAPEAKVVVYATTDRAAAQPLIDDFEALHPGVKVDYRELASTELHQRFLRETAAGTPTADVLWSSAMDLQLKLVNDGYAARHRTPELDRLPGWGVWRQEAYATTFEPVGLAYNRRLLDERTLPRTHAALARLLADPPPALRGRVSGYDLAAAGLGLLVATQDAAASPLFWDVARGLGANGVRLHASTAAMLDDVSAGTSVLAYNVLGSYARQRMRSDRAIGLVLFEDYTLVVSRVAFVARRAAHPQAARLWLDHLLSQRGQALLAQRSGLASLRADVAGEQTAGALERTLGASLRPIALQPRLMAHLEPSRRAEFLRRWGQALDRP